MAVSFQLLGEVEARIDGRVVDVGPARQRCVLATLLVDANRSVPVEQLMDRVWADRAPQRGREALYSYLSRLRQALAGANDVRIGRRSGGYLLTIDPMAVDLHRFHQLLARSRTASADEDAVVLLDRALGLWRGEAFAAMDSPWLNAVRDNLDRQRVAAELDRNDLALRRGQHTALLAGLSAAAGTRPLDERLAGQLLVAFYRCGRQADALSWYEQLRRRLADELGVDPSPPLRELHQRILTADASLAAPAPHVRLQPRRWASESSTSRHFSAVRRSSGGGGRVVGQGQRFDDRPGRPVFEIVGREEELGLVQAFLDESVDGPRVLVLQGEPGVGKSTLWLAGVEAALARGMRVLVSRPAQAERGLAHMGLADLFDDVVDEALPGLTVPRRRALEVALLRREVAGDPIDERTLAVAVRDMLRLLSERVPILIAIDDLQWLDRPSSDALAFALRRQAGSRVLMLLVRRPASRAGPSPLEVAVSGERTRWLPVGPLSAGALHRLLRDRLDRSFARQTLLRIRERSGGNPFFSLELARVLDNDVDPLQPLPVPVTLEDLVSERIAGLPASTRKALAFVAALGAPAEALLTQVDVAPDALDVAAAAHLIERDNGTIRFTHPLLSSVLYRDLGGERRRVHARIAEVVNDPLLLARHLALSRDGPDAEVAGRLDHAVRLATERGASAIAAELAEQALRLTPPAGSDERHCRALTAARAHHAAGEWTRARKIAVDLLAETGIGSVRAECLVLLAELESVDRSAQLLDDALREAASRPALQSKIHTRLAWATRFRQGFVAACQHARVALELADQLDDDALRVDALATLAELGGLVGDADALPHAAQAHDLATTLGDRDLLQKAISAMADVLLSCRSIDAGRLLLEREYRLWYERDELWTARVLWDLSWFELWGGRWQLAADHAARAHDISTQYGLEVPQDYLPIAVIAAHRGQLEFAREQSQRALQLAEEQLALHPPIHLAVLGLVAYWSGDNPRAEAWFNQADRQAATLGWGEPSERFWTADHAEMLLELGRIDDAVHLLDRWEADAKRLDREWVLAHVTRCRGLIAAARGRIDQAGPLLHQAVTQHQRVGDPFGRARALLSLGIVRRRGKQKTTAREAIRAALTGFAQLGAPTWVEKAHAELASIGGRVREDGLTAAERRVAALVAEGRTNREVAAALFLAERTVASHLTHVYAKLGVRSRTELARRLR